MRRIIKHKNVVYAGILGLVVLFIATSMVFTKTETPQLEGQEFVNKYKTTPHAILLDVRTPQEFSSGHILDAVNVDYQNPSFVDTIKKLDSNKTYFVYCRSGNRSSKAITLMKSFGIQNVYELKGGLVSNQTLLQDR